jgi:hypothetical protein
MSWNIGRITGRPAKVAQLAAEQFERAKLQSASFPEAERDSIVLAEKQVETALNFCVAQGCKAVSVEAGGCASMGSTDGTYPGSINVSVKVEPMHGFVE